MIGIIDFVYENQSTAHHSGIAEIDAHLDIMLAPRMERLIMPRAGQQFSDGAVIVAIHIAILCCPQV